MNWRVQDQVIIITGASKGIGFATAEVLLARGAKVALFARNPQRLDEAVQKLNSERAFAVAVDVSNKADLERAFALVEAKWGAINGLINNVGFQFARRIEIMPEAEVRQLVDMNFFSAVFGCQLAIPRMRKAGGGRIINISSATVRHNNEFAHLAIYSASKAAVDHFTHELREEVVGDNIMVTLFSPGAVGTGSVENFDPQALGEAMQAWLERGPNCDGAIREVGLVGEAIAHCFEYPPGVTVEFMEVKPRIPTPKMLESDWDESYSAAKD
ncbi:MAG TPA: SDR family oxidoreductase [Spongiibacteraceae bacterium]|nr:SDR family oxidoreductase [Spongiibacteraceae bacterium]